MRPQLRDAIIRGTTNFVQRNVPVRFTSIVSFHSFSETSIVGFIGPVEGERIREVMANYARLRNLGQDQIRKNMVERSSLKRMTRPEEVAAAVSFLVSREASAITGQDLNVNSGSGV